MPSEPITIYLRGPTLRDKLETYWREACRRIHRAWRLATVQGVPGVSYFHAKYDGCRSSLKVYLDGVDVTCRCFECDTSAGWAMLYDMHSENAICIGRNGEAVSRKHFGKVVVKHGR